MVFVKFSKKLVMVVSREMNYQVGDQALQGIMCSSLFPLNYLTL